MKKRTLSVLFVLILAFSLLTGCKNETSKTYTVTVHSPETVYPNTLDKYHYRVIDGFRVLYELEVKEGDVIGSLNLGNYQENKYRFLGWYTNEEYTEQWSLYKDEVRCNLSLYAKLERI